MSNAERSWPLDVAERAAWDLRGHLFTYCHMGECRIAGSVRRQAKVVHDLDFVCIPDFIDVVEPEVPEGALFPVETPKRRDQLLHRLQQLVDEGLLITPPETKNAGDRMRKYIWHLGGIDIPVQFFIVRPPAQLGVLLAIRTGPAEFAKKLVSGARAMGRRVKDGAVWPEGQWRESTTAAGKVEVETRGEPLLAKAEVDVFAQCGLRWVDPANR